MKISKAKKAKCKNKTNNSHNAFLGHLLFVPAIISNTVESLLDGSTTGWGSEIMLLCFCVGVWHDDVDLASLLDDTLPGPRLFEIPSKPLTTEFVVEGAWDGDLFLFCVFLSSDLTSLCLLSRRTWIRGRYRAAILPWWF